MASLKERSVHDEEMGMSWRDEERSWWWYHAPIETQAMMIEAFDEVTVTELRERARNALLTAAIVTEEKLESVADDLLGLDGMDKSLAAVLAEHGVRTRDELADLAVDELVEMTDIDNDRAMALISVARAHWFTE